MKFNSKIFWLLIGFSLSIPASMAELTFLDLEGTKRWDCTTQTSPQNGATYSGKGYSHFFGNLYFTFAQEYRGDQCVESERVTTSHLVFEVNIEEQFETKTHQVAKLRYDLIEMSYAPPSLEQAEKISQRIKEQKLETCGSEEVEAHKWIDLSCTIEKSESPDPYRQFGWVLKSKDSGALEYSSELYDTEFLSQEKRDAALAERLAD